MKAFEVQVGDRLPPSNIGQPLQTVLEVTVDPEDPTRVHLETDQGEWILPPDIELLFPRRPKGETNIFYPAETSLIPVGIDGNEIDGSNIRIDEIHVGDLVPNEKGWRLDEYSSLMLNEALLVTNIVYSGHGTYINLFSSISRRVRRLYVPLGQRFLYGKGCIWEEYGAKSQASSRFGKREAAKNASGVYMHMNTYDRVTFRIKGAPGRPRAGAIEAPRSRQEWDEYTLLPGEMAHPADPRKREGDGASPGVSRELSSQPARPDYDEKNS